MNTSTAVEVANFKVVWTLVRTIRFAARTAAMRRHSTSPKTPFQETLRHGPPVLVVWAVRKDETTSPTAKDRDLATTPFAT